MALNLVRAGHDVTGFDLSEDARSAFIRQSGNAAADLKDAVSDAEVIVTMLPAGRHVSAAYTDPAGILDSAPAGALLIDCSTIDVETARHISKAAADAGFPMLDAPVSGGVGGAEAGTLAFMVGGTEAAFERAKPFLEVMGRAIVHTGDSGAGQAAKICNNMILGVSMIAVSEAFALADRLGLDRQKLFDVAANASGQCWSLTTYCPVPGPVPTSPANRDYAAGFTAAMMLKDLNLASEAASTSGASIPLGAEAAQLYSLFCNDGNADRDFSAIFQMLSAVDRA